jgi:hypothetical protein
MSSDVLLTEAERLLAAHSPAAFDTSVDGFPDCIECVRRVEDEEGWRGGYPSLEAFTTLTLPAILTFGPTRECGGTSRPSAALLARLRSVFDSD